MRRGAATTVCGLVVVACGGSVIEQAPHGSASVKGVVNGQPFLVQDAIGLFSSDPPGVEAGVIIMDKTVSCAFVEQNVWPGNAAAFMLTVNADPAVLAPGTYSVLNYPSVRFQYLGICLATVEDAQDGTVTLTKVDSSTVAGGFDVILKNGDHVTGEFSAPVCGGAFAALTRPSPPRPPPACRM
jgi:hypothetical protein